MIKKFVFVLMPFDDGFDDIYELGIKGACEEVGAYCERVDEQIFSERILDRIYNQINKADLIIADMSNKNPNVFYEVGYSHALNKNVILLTQKAEDIPFDFKHFPHIIYENKITNLRNQLSKRLNYFINQTSPITKNTIESLELFIAGININKKPTIVLHEQSHDFLYKKSEFSFEIIYNNKGKSVFDNYNYVSLKIPRELSADVNKYSIINIPGDYVLYKFDKIPNVFPESWSKQNITIETKELDDSFTGMNKYPSEVLLNTQYGVFSYEVTLEFNFNPSVRFSEF